MLIGIHGKKGSGKSTLAVEVGKCLNYDGFQVSVDMFAKPLKVAACAMFGWEPDWLEDENFKSSLDPVSGKEVRYILQTLGTEWARAMIHQDIWMRLFQHRVTEFLRHPGRAVIVSDVRFENEAEVVRQMGGTIVHVLNYEVKLDENSFHPSEAGIERLDTDPVFVNKPSEGMDVLRAYARILVDSLK